LGTYIDTYIKLDHLLLDHVGIVSFGLASVPLTMHVSLAYLLDHLLP